MDTGHPGAEHCISSNQISDLGKFLQRLLVVGSGNIACEFASIFKGLGSQVIQLYRGNQVLRSFDDEIRDFLFLQKFSRAVSVCAWKSTWQVLLMARMA